MDTEYEWIFSAHNSENDYFVLQKLNGNVHQVIGYMLERAEFDKSRYEDDYDEECEYCPVSESSVENFNGTFLQTELCMSDSHMFYVAKVVGPAIRLSNRRKGDFKC